MREYGGNCVPELFVVLDVDSIELSQLIGHILVSSDPLFVFQGRVILLEEQFKTLFKLILVESAIIVTEARQDNRNVWMTKLRSQTRDVL